MDKSPKIDRKALRSPDEFVQKGRAVFSGIQQHRFFWIGIVGAVLVGSFGYYGYDRYTASRTEKNWDHYLDAMKQTGDQKWTALKTVYDNGGKYRPTYFAALGLADHYFDTAKKAIAAKTDVAAPANQAVDWYGKALEFPKLEPTEKQLLHINRGGSHELQSKWDDAIKDYQAASEIKGYGEALAKLNLGRVYEVKGDTAKAIEIYEKVSVEHANSEYARSAKNYTRRLKSPLFKSETPKTNEKK